MNKQIRFFALVVLLLHQSMIYTSNECYDTLSCQTSPVVTQSPCYSVDFFISALFLKPSAGNLHYAVEAIPLPLPSPDWDIFCVNPKYQPAFDVGFKLFMHETDAAFMVNWQRLQSCTRGRVNVGTDNMVGPFFEIGPDAAAYSRAQGKVKFLFDEINIDLGKLVCFGKNVQSNIYGGISVVRIKECLENTYANEDDTVVRTITLPITFKGAGPQVGIDTDCYLGKGFSLRGQAATALLVGNVQSHTTYSSISPADDVTPDVDVPQPNVQHVCACTSFSVVPSLAEKIGIAYTAEFCQDYAFRAEVGYQAQIYLGAIQSVDMSSEVVTPPVVPDTIGVFGRTFHKSISNFAVAGPYITFDFAF